MKKGDVGMAKRFSKKHGNKETRDQLQIPAIRNKGYVKMPVRAWCSSPLYLASVVLLQLHGGMVSHMLVLATPSSTVHNIKYLDPYHWNHKNLAAWSWGSDVGITIPVSVLFRESFSHPYISFFHLLINGFSVTSFRIDFVDPLPSLYRWAVSSANGFILVHTVQLTPMTKAQISGRTISGGISDVAFNSVDSEKTRLKKEMIMIIIITSNRKNHLLVNEKRRCRDG